MPRQPEAATQFRSPDSVLADCVLAVCGTAESSFVYVALADLIPQLQKRLPARQTALQIAWLVAGIVLVTLVSRLAHGGHDHEHEGAGHDAAHESAHTH